MVCNADGRHPKKANVEKVKELLQDLKSEQLNELLCWENTSDDGSVTALDSCLENDVECMSTIIEHVIGNSVEPDLLIMVFPYSASVTSTNLTEKILKVNPDHTQRFLKAITNQYDMNALQVACMHGNFYAFETIMQSLLDFDSSFVKYSITKCDKRILESRNTTIMKEISMKEKSALDWACYKGHTQIVSALLDSLQACGDDVVLDELLKQDWMSLRLAAEEGHGHVVSMIILEYTEVNKTDDLKPILNRFSYKVEKGDSVFQDRDKSFHEIVVKKILSYLDSKKDKESSGYGSDKTHLQLLQICLLFASETNNLGESSFHVGEFVPILSQILDKCMEHLVANHKEGSLSSIFPAFDLISEGVSYNRASSCHPLVMLAQTNHISLMKHPYIATYVDICWTSLARYAFYTNLTLYFLFLTAFGSFITSHDPEGSVSNTTFKSQNSGLTDASAFATIPLSVCLLIFEILQAMTKGKGYFKLTENSSDLLILIGSLVLTFWSITVGYNSWIHGFGCMLIVIAAIRGSLVLTHVPMVGDKFQMLPSVSTNVVKFLPVLIFFIVTFAIVFKNLLQKQETFSHVGFAVVKTMAMAIGEFDFNDIFFSNSDNLKLHEVVTFITFVLFLGIMTVSMMNLLIGVAVGDIGELRKHSEQEAFKSKVDLILQYNYMFPRFSKKLHQKPLKKFSRWESWHTKKWLKELDEAEKCDKLCLCCFFFLCCCFSLPFLILELYKEKEYDETLFLAYHEKLDREYKTYAIYRDPPPEVISDKQEAPSDDSVKQSDIEKLRTDMNGMKMQIDTLTKQNEQLIHIISELNTKQEKCIMVL